MFKKIIVGLGNPGKEYELTRHNVGQMFCNYFASQKQIVFKKKFNGMFLDCNIENFGKICFFFPGSYMNLSGSSIKDLIGFYKISVDNLIVFHDDIDMELGKVRMKKGGGSGGHNGIKSIDKSLGSTMYWRVKIGVGRPYNSNDVSDYVLGKFNKDELYMLEDIFNKISIGFREICSEKIEIMQFINNKIK